MDGRIEVEDLRKVFRVRARAAGLRNALRQLVRPQERELPALDGLSFSIAPGVQMTEHVTAEAAAASPLYKATHGHDPRAPALGAALIFTGPGAPEGHTLGRVSMLDVAPTVARMLGVTLPDAEGRPLLS